MTIKTLLRLLLALIALTPTVGAAHGGVAIEDDACIMTIGPYRAHFSGYQPKVRASREFCEDIPVVADAIIVLDFISQPLRDLVVDFRIVRDVKAVGVNATFEDLGTAQEIEAATVVYRAPERYPNGNVDVALTFDAAGAFIGVMTAVDAANAREYVAVFPFSVGKTDWLGPLRWVLLVMVLVTVVYVLAPKTKAARPSEPPPHDA